jgi:hypothetical protein
MLVRTKGTSLLKGKLGRLPTRENLVRRGAGLEGLIVGCMLCGVGREMEDHLFASCPIAWEVWFKVYRWFSITSVVGSIYNWLIIPMFSSSFPKL